MIKRFIQTTRYATNSRSGLAFLLVALITACGQGDMDADPSASIGEADGADVSAFERVDQDLIAGCTALGVEVNAHACQHGSLGPFAAVTAKTAATYNTFAATHTYYTVSFTDVTAPYTGRVDYSPSVTSDYVIYYNPSVTVTVKDKNGTTVNPLLNGSLSSCSYLSGYRIFNLSSSTSFKPYQVTFTSATTAPVQVLLENVNEAAMWWYKDMDGDAWGNSAQKQLTPCIPDPAYTVKQGGDCNDGHAGINPGATEVSGDGVDSNCNGNDND
jgi:hypothetical protein